MSTNNNEKIEIHVLDTANRLRKVQVDFADESDQVRIGHLCEEIEEALRIVLPTEKNEFFRRLLERFPAGSFLTPSTSTEQKVEDASDVESNLSGVNFLVRSLLEIVLKCSEDQKPLIVTSPQQDELEPKAQQEDYVELDEILKEKLPLANMNNVNRAQLLKLSMLLIDFVLRLDPLVWNTWRALSPRSNLRPQGTLDKTIGQFLADDSEISENQIDHDIKVLQRLVAALSSAVSQVGSQFAKRHLAKFSPSEISALVRMEHGSVFVSHEVKCWRKYIELAEMLHEDSIEMEIRKTIVGYVESLTKGIG